MSLAGYVIWYSIPISWLDGKQMPGERIAKHLSERAPTVGSIHVKKLVLNNAV